MRYLIRYLFGQKDQSQYLCMYNPKDEPFVTHHPNLVYKIDNMEYMPRSIITTPITPHKILFLEPNQSYSFDPKTNKYTQITKQSKYWNALVSLSSLKYSLAGIPI